VAQRAATDREDHGTRQTDPTGWTPVREDCAGCEFAERSLQGVAILQDGRLIYVNPVVAEIAGRTQEELLSLPPDQVTAIIHPEDRVRSLLAVQNWLEGPDPLPQEAYRIVHRDGTVRWLTVRAIPFEYRGKPAVQVAVMDVTESREAQQALQRKVEEVQRQQRLLLALSRAAQAVERARSPGEVYHVVGEELSRLGFSATILTLTDDEEHLVVSHATHPLAVVRAAERVVGHSLVGYRFPLTPGGFHQQVIENGKAIFMTQPSRPIAEALPEPVRGQAGKVARLLGIRERIAAPLAAGGQVYGVLTVTGSGLSEADVPAISAFADQAAIAIQNAELLDAVDRQRDELRQLSTHLMHAQEMERRRIAQELHDETGQTLTALSINLAEMERALSSDLLPAEAERLAESRALTDQTLAQIRELSLSLRPSLLDDLGLAPALRWYTNNYARRTGIAVRFEASGLDERLSPGIETALYRVVQEALTNVVRHADANGVTVQLQGTESKVVAVVQDDGRGFDPQARRGRDISARGIGLLGMRERIALLGGGFRIDSRPGRGTRISVDIPLKDKAQA
jgi:PAS domain S-box-containing protein